MFPPPSITALRAVGVPSLRNGKVEYRVEKGRMEEVNRDDMSTDNSENCALDADTGFRTYATRSFCGARKILVGL